jgi:hypothetical protein
MSVLFIAAAAYSLGHPKKQAPNLAENFHRSRIMKVEIKRPGDRSRASPILGKSRRSGRIFLESKWLVFYQMQYIIYYE